MNNTLAVAGLLCVSTSTLFAQNILNLEGSVNAWNFDDGNGVQTSDATFNTNGVISAYVDTSGGFGETSIYAQANDQAGLVQFEVNTLATGNGVWNMQMTFDLTDSIGDGWIIETFGDKRINSNIILIPDESSATPGMINQMGDDLIATAGSYLLTVNDPFWQDYFNPDGIFDQTWTNASGDYTLEMRQVPSPSALLVLPFGFALANIRKR